MRKKRRTRTVLSRRASAPSRSRARTPTRAPRRRPVRRRIRRQPLALPVRPSVALLALGGLLILWQLGARSVAPGMERWFPARLAGMSGILIVLCGLVVLWMEAAGLRQAQVKAVRRRPVRKTVPVAGSVQGPEKEGASPFD